MAKDNRYRNWVFILYPDSAPDDWIQQLEDLHVPCYISPLHDQDRLPDGSLKKPHYHIGLTYNGKKSYEDIKAITDRLCQPRPEPMQDLGGSLRYFCHIDSPDKARYLTSGVVCLSGADYFEAILSASGTKQLIREIKLFIQEHDIWYYSTLSDYASFCNPEWENVIDHNSVFWKTYLSARVDKKQKHVTEDIDQLILTSIGGYEDED